MRLNPILPDGPSPVPDAVPARPAHPRPQTLSSTPARSLPAVTLPPPGTADDVKVHWKGNDGVIVTFTDKKSGEVVRQIPSEQVLSVARFIRQMLQKQETPKAEPNRSR